MDQAKSPVRDWLALAFASLFPLALTLLYFVVLSNPQGETNPTLVAVFGIGKCVQFLFPAVFVWWFEREQIRFVAPTLGGLALGGAFGLIVSAAMLVLFFAWVQHMDVVVFDTPMMINDRLRQFGRATPGGYLQMGIYICCLHSLAEEYYWRWFVFGWMRRYVPVYGAMALSGVGFMLHHVVLLVVYFPGHFWSLVVPFALCVALGGAIWAWLYQRTGSLSAAWLSHGIVDAAIMTLGYEMLRGYWE